MLCGLQLQLTVAYFLRLQEGLVEVSGQQRLRQVPEELLEQRGHVVRTVIRRQLHVTETVELLPQMSNSLLRRGDPEDADGVQAVLQ